MKLLRKLHRLYANVRGRFWLPCPMCGEYFGGHEWRHTRVGMTTIWENVTSGVCNTCALAVLARHPGAYSVSVDPDTKQEFPCYSDENFRKLQVAYKLAAEARGLPDYEKRWNELVETTGARIAQAEKEKG